VSFRYSLMAIQKGKPGDAILSTTCCSSTLITTTSPVLVTAVKAAGYGISGASDITQYKERQPKKSGKQTTGYQTLNIDEVAELTDEPDVTLINVHIPYAGEIPGTDAFMPFNRIKENQDKLPGDKTAKVVLYCRSGHMSKMASKILTEMGYITVYDVPGGMNAWRSAGNELTNKSQ